MVYPIRDPQGFFDKLTDLVLGGKTHRRGRPLRPLPDEARRPGRQAGPAPRSSARDPDRARPSDRRRATPPKSIQKRTTFLATIANVATLLGLFGTIAGLIAPSRPSVTPIPSRSRRFLAAGISHAMNATMLGLAVAIPCMVAFSFLMNRTNRLIADIEQSAVRAMDILKQRYYSAELRLGRRRPRGCPDNGGKPANLVQMRRPA